MCTGARRYRAIRRYEGECLVRTDREEHAVALQTAYGSRLEVRHERELAIHQGFRLGDIRGDTGDNLSQRCFAEVDREAQELVGFRHALRRAHGAYLHLYLAEIIDGDAWLTHGPYGKDNW